MEQRNSPNDDDNEDGKETTKSSNPGRARSRQEDEARDKPLNRKEEDGRTMHPRGRRKPEARLNRNIVTGSEKGRKNVTSGVKRTGKKYDKERVGVSDKSDPIRRRPSRRLTRASINLPGKYKRENVPAIPKRVFKALHILRHEKFLRVASRYLKPRAKE